MPRPSHSTLFDLPNDIGINKLVSKL
jgi:hypothetical protein